MLSGAGNKWRTRGLKLTMGEFEHLLGAQSSHNLVGVEPVTGQPVVLCSTYGEDIQSQSACLAVVGDTSHPRALPAVGDAIEQYLQYLFSVIGLRKVTIELPASQSERLGATLHRWSHLAVLEGVLRQHVRMGSVLEDLYVYGILASDWAIIAEPHLTRSPGITRSEPPVVDSEFDLVRSAIVEVLGNEIEGPLDGGLLLAELGLDSLAMVEVLSILEEETGRPLEVHDPQRPIRSVVDLAELCRNAALHEESCAQVLADPERLTER